MEYLSTREIMQRFGWTSRAMVSQVALRERWVRLANSRPRQYRVQDIEDFEISRTHTRLAYGGALYANLIRHTDGYSDKCPVCKNALTNNEK